MLVYNPDLYKSELSKNICSAYNKLISLIESVPAEKKSVKLIDGTGGKVSVADRIAYQIGWGKLLLSWYEAGVHSKKPQMPGNGFSTWDYSGLANSFYATYRYDDGEKQLLVFHEVVTAIIAFVDHEHISGNLDKLGVWDWCTLSSGKQWPLNKWAQVNTVAPYKRAASLIRDYFK